MKKKIKKIATGINEHRSTKENREKIEQSSTYNQETFTYRKSKKKKMKCQVNYKKHIENNSKMQINPKNKMKYKQNKIEKENIKNYIDEEINGLSYHLAEKFDKRTYCQYYMSLLKTQHNLICALFNNNDYNSGIIKIDLFFICFTIEYTVNALFYNDDTMHKIYESKGQFDLVNQIPIISNKKILKLIL